MRGLDRESKSPVRGTEGGTGAAVPIASEPLPRVRHYDEIARFYDRYADESDRWLAKTGGYHTLIRRIYRSLIPSGQRVLEIGCGRGDLLASVEPSYGVGVDVSSRMIEIARDRHPQFEFDNVSGEALQRNETFDFIVLSDLVPYAHDLQALFGSVAAHCNARTRVIVNTYSNVWRPVLAVLALLRLRDKHPIRNWIGPRDLVNLVDLAGLQVVAQRREILLPAEVPLLSRLANSVLARLPAVRQLTLSYWLLARPAPRRRGDHTVSVIVPCRNEAGSIREIVERVPNMGSQTEILFVEGHSTDDTRERIQAEIERRPDRQMRLIVQSGRGKANAVREGFAAANHDILMILDADLTVAPEDLPKFYDAIVSGRGELVNGTRLVYGMEPGAMRFLNMIANQLFASLFSWLLGQYVKDTLCGTKVLWRSDYERMERQRHELDEDDPYGDFELLLGASMLGLKIENLPVRYRARTYGETNIERFSGGALLLRLAIAGYRRIWIRSVAA